MLEITICVSILKEMQSCSLTNVSDDVFELERRLRQHTMVISQELQSEYLNYFRQNNLNIDWLKQYLLRRMDTHRILSVNKGNKTFSHGIDSYLDAILNTCFASKDKLLLSENTKIKNDDLKKAGIERLGMKQILDKSVDNTFTKYTLPIINYCVKEGQDSKELAEWLGRFIECGSYYTLYDNYFSEKDNLKNFKKYVLKYIPKGSEVEVNTLVEDDKARLNLESQLKTQYPEWKISVRRVSSKKDSHARILRNELYTMNIDRGLSVFGRDGKTFASIITISESELLNRYDVH